MLRFGGGGGDINVPRPSVSIPAIEVRIFCISVTIAMTLAVFNEIVVVSYMKDENQDVK